MEQFFEFCFQNCPRDLPRDEEKITAVDDHLCLAKDVVTIFPTSFGINLIYQLYMQNSKTC